MEGNGLGHGHTNRQWDIGTGRKGQNTDRNMDRTGTEGQMDRDWTGTGQGQDMTGTGHDRDRGTVTGIVRQGQRNNNRGTATGIVRQGQRNKDRHRDRDRGTVT